MIHIGDSVWAEDTVTGERVLKKVLKVYVKENDHLLHIVTSTGEDIKTTENHPFYIDGRGWVAASEVREGDQLHTKDGSKGHWHFISASPSVMQIWLTMGKKKATA